MNKKTILQLPQSQEKEFEIIMLFQVIIDLASKERKYHDM